MHYYGTVNGRKQRALVLFVRCRGDMDEDEDLDSKTPLQHLNVDSDAAAVMALERAHNTTNTVSLIK